MNRPVPTIGGFGRRLSVAFVILALLAVGADFGVRIWAEGRLAASVQRSFELPEKPNLDLDGFPFLLRLAQGRFASATVESEDVVLEGLRVASVRIDGRDVRFSFRDLVRGGEDAVVLVHGGSGSLEVDDESLSEYIQNRSVPITVEFLGPEVRTSTTVSIGEVDTVAEATGQLEISDGSLLFTPETVSIDGEIGVPPEALAFRVPLPTLVEGAVYERVIVGEGTARLEFTLTDVEIRAEG